jgi:hypothetical protein
VDNSTIGILSLLALLAAAIGMVIFSVVFMNGEGRHTAEINRQHNQPISNGYAIAATVTIIVVFALVFLFGLLPPLLRRG